MADAVSIKDLPDTAKINDRLSYVVPGKWLRAIVEILQQLWRGENIGKGPNIRIRQNGLGGFTISGANQTSSGSGSGATNFPFEIFANKHLEAGVWDGSYDVKLYPGTVTGLLPTNIFNTINTGISSTQYVELACSSDGYAVTSSTWSLVGTPTPPEEATADAPPDSFSVLIGAIYYTPPVAPATAGSITIYQIINNNVNAAPTEWTRTTRSGIGPFELAYQIFYYWKLT